jgi:hypothetical protein
MQTMETAAEEPQFRILRDEADRQWEVRAIRPPDTERRARLLPPAHANGWLLFTLGDERRRLAPLPQDWQYASEAQLHAWWTEARPVKPWSSKRRGEGANDRTFQQKD